VVEEELPDDLKAKAEALGTRGEANLRGHLKGEDANKAEDEAAKKPEGESENEDAPAADEEEQSGSSSYVAPEKDKDTQLNYALDLLRGIKSVDTEAKKKAEAN
jgi:carboxyl-terminal processing protease